jgi:ABC-type Zn2+ transport system substrate-binding protein/surface adhesin
MLGTGRKKAGLIRPSWSGIGKCEFLRDFLLLRRVVSGQTFELVQCQEISNDKIDQEDDKEDREEDREENREENRKENRKEDREENRKEDGKEDGNA